MRSLRVLSSWGGDLRDAVVRCSRAESGTGPAPGSRQDQHLAGEGQPGAVAEHQRQVAGLAPRRTPSARSAPAGPTPTTCCPTATMSRATTVRLGRSRAAWPSTRRCAGWPGAGRTRRCRPGATPAFSIASTQRPAVSLVVAQRKTAWPSWPRNWPATGSSISVDAGRRRCPRRPGRCPARRDGPADDRGAGAVGEDDRRRPVGRVGHVGEPLDADDEHVAGVAGA